MNRPFLLSISILLYGLISCNGPGKPGQAASAVERTDTCNLDPENTYEVYIPERIDRDQKLPLLIIIDAHGNGQFALDHFKQGALQYPAILVASNLVKNGFGNYEGAIQTLIGDVRQKYPAGGMVFVAGFSGGARMAMGYALAHRVSGLIMCGALAQANQINAVHCPVISISGTDDFNFIETAQYLFQGQSIPGNLKIELTEGSHNWPDSLLLANAYGFLYLSCESSDIQSPAKAQIRMYCLDQEARIDTLMEHEDFLKALLVARNMSSTVPFNNDQSFASTYDDLKTNPNYISQLNHLRKLLDFEINVRQQYTEAFITKDSLWWDKEIKTIDGKIETEQDPFTNDMYRRIKGFWGIACYSLGNEAIKGQNAGTLKKIVSIYRMVEPENPWVLYFSAFPYYWKGDNEEAISMLKRAKEAGFTDISQLNKDFPGNITSHLD